MRARGTMDRCVGLWTEGRCCARMSVLILFLFVGCSGLRRMGPISQDVILARQLSQQGIDAWQRGQRREAEQVFSQAVSCCPDDAAARCRLADCLWDRGETRAAIGHLTKAVQLSDYSDPEQLVKLGGMRLATGQIDEASALADRAVQLDGRNAASWRLRGAVLARQGQLNEAIESYYRSLSYDSQDVETLLAVAQLHQKLGRPNRSLATLNRLEAQLAEKGAPQPVWVLKGLAQQQLHRYDDALQSFSQARQQGPASAFLLEQLARVQWQLGQHADAERTLQDALAVARPAEQPDLRALRARMARIPDDSPQSPVR